MAADHFHDPAIAHLREAPAAPFRGRGHPQHAQLGQPVDDGTGNVGVAVDRRGVDVRVGELAYRGDRLLDRRPLALGQLGVREERAAPEFAPKERLGKPGLLRPVKSSSSACWSCLARKAWSVSCDAARSGAEVVTAMATDSLLIEWNRGRVEFQLDTSGIVICRSLKRRVQRRASSTLLPRLRVRGWPHIGPPFRNPGKPCSLCRSRKR